MLTISDRCSRGETKDTAGPALAALLDKELDAHLYALEIVPDEQEQIEKRFRHYCNGHSIDLVCAVGGTGFAPRDVTPEAVAAVVDRPTPGIDEAMRQASLKITPHAILSRATSGIRGATLVISLPGSERGATENMRAILPGLDHGLRELCARGLKVGVVKHDVHGLNIDRDGKTWLERTVETVQPHVDGIAILGAGEIPEGLRSL